MKINKLMEKMPCPAGDLHKIREELLVIRNEIVDADKKYNFGQLLQKTLIFEFSVFSPI